MAWRPAASLATLRRRATILAAIRGFFAERGVLEVETPVLAAAGVTDVHLSSPRVRLDLPGQGELTMFLQTSPEYHMKRLLAAGSGPIFQICKAFRDGEAGRLHNPEFTILEWYRPGFDHHQLMDEMDDLLGRILGTDAAERLSYAEAFVRHAGIDPHRVTEVDLAACTAACGGLPLSAAELDRDGALDLIRSAIVEPCLGRGRPSFVFDWPASQAALARVRPGDPPLAERFEVYVDGIELANGFHELADVDEQRRRFELDRAGRRRRGLPDVAPDERLLAALDHGLPACAGVALGVDRLVMLATGASAIDEVLSFPIDRA